MASVSPRNHSGTPSATAAWASSAPISVIARRRPSAISTANGWPSEPGLAVQDVPTVAVLADEGEEGEHAAPELLLGGQLGVDDRADGVDQPPGLPLDAHREELLLGAQVRVHHRLGDPGHVGDLVHGRRVVAALGEHRGRGVQDLPLPHGAGQPLGAGRPVPLL
nr:hypothetical protein GCM10020241_38560 [Streptoalloteichus tenebrarius]